MNVALDTNAFSDFIRGDPKRLDIIQTADRIYLPFITLGELRAGFVAGNKQSANASSLHQFLQGTRVSIVMPDEQTTSSYASLHFQLKRQGTPIPSNDLWIAALVVQHNLVLCTSDAHFNHLPQILRC